MARNNSASTMYQNIENERCADLFYGLLFDDTIKMNVYRNTSEILQGELKNKSDRLVYAFNQIEKSDSNLLYHTLVIFAMTQNENCYHYIISHYDGKRKEEVKEFINKNLKVKTEKLLNGQYRSLTEYIDEARTSIAIELGFQ